jgi:hypothetical protein
MLAALVIVAAACDSSDGAATTSAGSGDPETTTTVSSTTTTVPPITSIPPDRVPGTASESIPPEVEEQMRSEIGVIILDVEETRGLPFIEVPVITILDEEEFSERVEVQLLEELDEEETAQEDAFYSLLGMLGPDDDLRSMLVELYGEQVAGFYDGTTKEMVVPVSVDGISPLQEIVIAHELVHVLTDQHFEFNDEFERLIDEGTQDDARGYQGLIEGDDTYQQFLYLESMDPARAAEAALEVLSADSETLEGSPQWLQADLAFPYEYGLRFAGFVIEQNGLKGVDEAYQEPPISTEQIIDPNKFLRDEQPLPLENLTVDLEGWDLAFERTFGEWGLRLLLLDTVTPGTLSQATGGWGNDTYRFFVNGEDTALAWSYLGESIEDAEDLANALVVHARDVMGAGGAVESGGGLLFEGGSPWVFVDRVDDRIFFVASTDAAAGEDLRSQLGL